jgi:hypothetical protein
MNVSTRRAAATSTRSTGEQSPLLLEGRGGLIDWLLPFCASLSLLVACVVISDKKPMWYDELLTRTLLTDPSLSHMLKAMASGAEAAPPFYHFLARAWIALFGSSPLSIRLMSWAGFSVAIGVCWRILRSAFDRVAAAFALLAFFCGSLTVLQQVAEIRFYGLLTALVSTGVLLSYAAMQREQPSLRLLVCMSLLHACLVLCHFFGFVYSGVLLCALVVWDLGQRRLRPRVYLAVFAGWLAYLPWVAPTLSQARMGGEQGNWTPIPGIPELLAALGFQIPLLPLLLWAVLLISVLSDMQGDSEAALSTSEAVGSSRLALVHIAYALIAVVPLVFVFSRVAVSLFLDRYLLPAGFGCSILLAELVTRLRTRSSSRSGWTTIARVGFAILAAVLLANPLYRAVTFHVVPRPGAAVEAMQVNGEPVTDLPIAVESNLAFLPLVYYAPQRRATYFFVVDSEVAKDPRNILGAPMENKAMQVFRQQGYFSKQIVDGADFLCANARFAVIDDRHHMWTEQRVLSDSAFATIAIGTFSTMHDSYIVRAVTRRADRIPAGCARPMVKRRVSTGVPRA